VVESRGGVTGWWCHMKESLVVSHMLGCHVKDSGGGVMGWCHTCRGVTWWSQVVESHEGVTWQS
jgi:hypothetical protein